MSKFIFREFKSYISIFAFFIIIFAFFESNMSFADDCSQIKNYTSLDRCRENNFSFTDKVDRDGNLLIKCKGVSDFNYDPFNGNASTKDYHYDSHNRNCLAWGLSATLIYTTLSSIATATCPSPATASKAATNTAKQIALKALQKGISSLPLSVFSVISNPVIILTAEFAFDSLLLIGGSLFNLAYSNLPGVALCLGAEVVLGVGYSIIVFAALAGLYDESKAKINVAKICGYDWNNFAYTSSEMRNPKDEWYPSYGSFSNSYSYKLDKCFLYGEEKALSDYGVNCDEIKDGEGLCKAWTKGTYKDDTSKNFNDKLDCIGVNATYKNVRNRAYREKLYKGKEYKISTTYRGSLACIDPRLDSIKGYTSLEQRYYFRGKESAQYACDRFKYKNNGCRLSDGTTITKEQVVGTSDLAKENTRKCKEAFEEANNCCQNRRALGICIYNIDKNDRDVNTMCLRSLDDSEGGTCSLETKGRNPEFVAFTSSAKSTNICIKNINFCPYSYNIGGGTVLEELYCNGDYLNPQCNDYNKIWKAGKYRYPTSAYGQPKNFCFYNAHCTEIGESDYEFADLTGNKYFPKVCSDFIGDSQNLPYPVRLVDLSIGSAVKKAFTSVGVNIGSGSIAEINKAIDIMSDKQLGLVYSNIVLQRSLLAVMTGLVGGVITGPVGGIITGTVGGILYSAEEIANAVKSKGDASRSDLKGIVKIMLDKPLISDMDFSIGEYRGFTAPIAQCIKETLNNMFNNKAGQSLCLNPKEEINSEGLCGNDTFGPPEHIRRNEYYYVTGDDLPADSNIFYKIQSRVQNLIKIIAVLAIIVIAIKFLLKGELDIFSESKRPKNLIVGMLKFAIVFYFAVGNAWQQSFYRWLDDSTQWIFYKSFDLSMIGYQNYKNQDTKTVCNIVKNNKTCEYLNSEENCKVTENKICKEITEDKVQEICKTFIKGESQFIVPNGVSKLQLDIWGASGGNTTKYNGGKGGRSYGDLNVRTGDILTIKVGGTGQAIVNGGDGYNGGGLAGILNSEAKSGGGGGRSEISKGSTLLIVAGGGGGGGYKYSTIQDTVIEPINGGAGGGGSSIGLSGANESTCGGLPGGNGLGGKVPNYTNRNCIFNVKANEGTALKGGDSINNLYSIGNAYGNIYSGGGGGGYGAGASGSGYHGGGGGGGYIGGVINGGGESGANEGNGKVQVCYTQIVKPCITFNYTGSEQSYIIPEDVKDVKLEVWGASGEFNNNSYIKLRGKGGYSLGNLQVKKENKLYIYVGGENGYNGGGLSSSRNNGGGATDIRYEGNLLTNRIIVAGGGAGASGATDTTCGYGGGGNNNGGSGTRGATGGTQTSGGVHADIIEADYNQTSGAFGIGGNTDGYSAGGGGWYGGGGGSWWCGGGGSGHLDSSLTESSGESGVNVGNGRARICILECGIEEIKECETQQDIVCSNNSETLTNQTIDSGTLEKLPKPLPDYNNQYCLDTIKGENGSESATCYTNCGELNKYDENGFPLYTYSDTYDGCYFGDNAYPEGKKYLSVFDSLDCKLMNYFNYGPDLDLPGILHMLLISLFFSPLAIVIVLLGSILFVILLSVVIKILYIFLMSIIAINVMVFVSPIILPTLLFEKYKGIFNSWLDNIIGFALQTIFVAIFAGLLIGTMERFTVGSAKFVNHDPATGRLPTIICGDSTDSILCIFKINVNKGEKPLAGEIAYKILGIGPLVSVIDSISRDFIGTVVTLLKFCLIMYVMLSFSEKIPDIAARIVGSRSFRGGNIDRGAVMKGIKNTTGNITRGFKNASGKAIRGAATGAKGAYGKAKEGLSTARTAIRSKNSDTNTSNKETDDKNKSEK